MTELKLQCQCGKVTGCILDAKGDNGNHLTCYCTDCQAFANHLDNKSNTLNAYGGTEIFQVAPANFKILSGQEHLACLKLSDKGIHRWYSTCCNTPIANTVGLKLPFVGVIHRFFADSTGAQNKIGPILGSVHLQGATDKVPSEILGPQSHYSIVFRVLRKILGWKLFGQGKPTALYQGDGKAICKPEVIKQN